MLNKRKPLMSARQVESYDKVYWIFDRHVDSFDSLQNDLIDEHLTSEEIDMLCEIICDYLKEF